MNLRNVLMSVSALTLLSRIAGFARDWLIAHTFGAGANTDAFFVAFRFPNLLRRLFAEGAFSQAFVPMLMTQRNQSPHEYRQFINKTSTGLLLIVTLVSLLGIFFAPSIVRLTAPGFIDDPEKFELTVFLTRWCFPYILWISALSLLSAILQCEKHFAIPALAPLFLNVSMIMMMLLTLSWWDNPVHVLAYAAILGGALQVLGPAIVVVRRGLLPRFDWYWMTAPVRMMLKNMLPALLGVASGQINLLLNTVFASYLVTGAVSWLYYADRLMELPVGLLGAALATILLPSLSQAAIEQSKQRTHALVDWGLRLTLWFSLPVALAFLLCGPMLFMTLFQYGEFQTKDAIQAGKALSVYSLGLMPLIAQKILAPVFFAKKNLRTPAWIGFFALIINQLQNLIWVPLWGHVGLALSISITACIQCIVLYMLLWRQGDVKPNRALGMFLLKMMMALIVLGLFIYWFNPSMVWWEEATSLQQAVRLAFIVFWGGGAYGLMWWIMGMRPKDFSFRV